jgi:hypothetical protein
MTSTPVQAPPQLLRLRAVEPPAEVTSDAVAEYLTLSDRLKQLRGTEFEMHGHPAVVLDRATSPTTRVWGWWADAETPVPCVLWASERGWSVTAVEAGELDSEGYERAFWAHRVALLDLALATALGPFPTLEELELNVAADGSFGFGSWGEELRAAVLWGVRQLRVARARGHRGRRDEALAQVSGARCSVDQELVRFGLVPTLTKSCREVASAQEAGLEALLRAVRRAGSGATSLDERRLTTHG